LANCIGKLGAFQPAQFNILSDAETDGLCRSFSQFFIDKISDLKQAVARDPNSISSPSPELLHLEAKLENLTPVTTTKSHHWFSAVMAQLILIK